MKIPTDPNKDRTVRMILTVNIDRDLRLRTVKGVAMAMTSIVIRLMRFRDILQYMMNKTGLIIKGQKNGRHC